MRLIVPAWILLLAAAAGPCMADSRDFAALLSGKDVPATLLLKDLDAGWSRVTVAAPGSGTASAGEALKDLATVGMASNGGGSSSDAMGLAVVSSLMGGSNGPAALYTKGQTVAIGSETFLIAYKYEEPKLDLMQIVAESEKQGGAEPDIQKLLAGRKMTADSPLNLSLVNIKNIGTMTLVRQFDMDKEIAESGRSPLMDMLTLRASQPTATRETATEGMPPGPPGPPGMAVPPPPPVKTPAPQAKTATYWGNLGWDQYGKGQVQAAIASSRKAVAMNPRLAYVRLNLGLYYAVLGNAAQSRKEYAAGIKLASASDIRSAIADVNAALKKKPKSATLKQALRTLQAAGKR